MKKRIYPLLISMSLFQYGLTQNIGIGKLTPQATLDINGDMATRTANLNITTTYNYALDINTVKQTNYKLLQTAQTAFNFILAGIAAGVDGRTITLINRTGASMEIYNNDANATIGERIITGTNNTLAIYGGGTVTLKYDGADQQWEVISSHYNSLDYFGGGGNSNWNINGADIVNSNPGNVGIGNSTPLEKLDINGNVKVHNSLFVDGNIGIGTNSPTDRLQVVDANLASGVIRIGGNNTVNMPRLIKFGDADFVTIGENTMDDRMELTATRFYFRKSDGTIPQVGIGISTSGATLAVVRGIGLDGTAAFFGTTNTTHFNYGTTEDTYLRGGKIGSKVFINDYGGQVSIGTTFTGTAQLNIVSQQIGAAANGLSVLQTTTNTGNDSYGINLSVNGSNLKNFGILAEAGATGQVTNTGGLFRSRGNTPVGVNIGVEGVASNSTINNYAGKFTATGGGTSTENFGVHAEAQGPGDNYGVFGYATPAVNDNNSAAYGVYGRAPLNASYASYAGYFDGRVAVSSLFYAQDITCDHLAKLSGSFKIDHPEDPANKYLIHSFVESPDMMNIYNGNIITNSEGLAVVDLPHYFATLNKDYRYQLTVLGQFAQAIIFEKISNNKFTIKTDKPMVEVSWMVTGIRQDAWANANRIVPEVEKEERNKGKYLAPAALGQPAEKGINYAKP